MPNNVANIVRLDGDVNEIKKLVEFVKNDNEPFDFEQIIPMPPKIIRGALTYEDQIATKGRNWYDWSNDHWDTKWNCYNTNYSEEDFTYSFDTAWNAPLSVIKELSRLFPNINISYMWCDEDFYSGNCGEAEFEDGQTKNIYCPETDAEIKEIAKKVLGVDIVDDEDDYEEYYDDCEDDDID